MPITNQAIFDNLILLEEQLNKLSDILIYQSRNIEDLKDDNKNVIEKVNYLENKIYKNSIIQAVKIDNTIKPILYISSKHINNYTILTSDNDNEIDYLITSNHINLLKDKLDIKIEEDQINKITKLKTSVDSKKTY